MLRINPDVRINYFTRRLGDALEYASVWSLQAREDVFVTSIDDKQHGEATLHGASLAVDLSVAGNVDAKLERLYRFLARYLPAEFDVVLELDHVHVEWDMHRRLAATPKGPAPKTPPVT